MPGPLTGSLYQEEETPETESEPQEDTSSGDTGDSEQDDES